MIFQQLLKLENKTRLVCLKIKRAGVTYVHSVSFQVGLLDASELHISWWRLMHVANVMHVENDGGGSGSAKGWSRRVVWRGIARVPYMEERTLYYVALCFRVCTFSLALVCTGVILILKQQPPAAAFHTA